MWGTLVFVLILGGGLDRPAVVVGQFAYEKDCQAVVEILQKNSAFRSPYAMCVPMQNMRPM